MEPLNNALNVLLIIDDDADSHTIACDMLSQMPAPGTRLQWATDYEPKADAVRTGGFDGPVLVGETLVTAEEKYRGIFENAAAGIFQASLDGRFLCVNPAFARILRYDSPEEVVNTIVDISRQVYVDPEVRSELLRRLVERDVVRELEARFLCKNGDIAWVVLSMRTVRDTEGKIRYLEGTVWDITARKAMEGRLIQHQKMEAIGTLAGGIAHDFNNILAAIMGYAELAQQDTPTSKIDYYTQQILKSCNRARDLVSQILTFSRKTELELVPIDMVQLAEESLRLFRKTIPSPVEICTKIDRRTCMVMGDTEEMQQIIMNLCTNAAHAMRDQGGTLEVALGNILLSTQTSPVAQELPAGPYVRLSVSDTGTGIPPSIMGRIFDPFFTTKERRVGTGLGLSVVYAVVKERGGAISVRSVEGKGASFTVYLPAASAPTMSESEAIESSPDRGKRILLVDDEEVLVEMAHEMLQELGYRVVAVKSSSLALELFLAQPEAFDLIITDMTMPGMTGAEIAEKMLAVRPRVPIILCTGFSELITEERAKQLGIREFLMKPYSLSDLSRTLERVLRDARGVCTSRRRYS